MNNLVVVTSAYNEALNLPSLLDELHGYHTILVDDGSTDATAQIARDRGAHVARHGINLGQGFAFVTGLKLAMETKADYIVYMDADGQHRPGEIPRFIKELEKGGYDVVVGSRIIGRNYRSAPLARRFFLPYFTRAINFITGYRMTDSMCGFRAYRRASLLRCRRIFNEMLEPQYIAAEMFIRFAKAGLTVGEVPVTLCERSSGVSYKGLLRYGFGILRAIARVLFDTGRQRNQ